MKATLLLYRAIGECIRYKILSPFNNCIANNEHMEKRSLFIAPFLNDSQNWFAMISRGHFTTEIYGLFYGCYEFLGKSFIQ